MRWRDNIFKLLSIENINGNKLTFIMPMFSSLGGGNLYNLVQQLQAIWAYNIKP